MTWQLVIGQVPAQLRQTAQHNGNCNVTNRSNLSYSLNFLYAWWIWNKFKKGQVVDFSFADLAQSFSIHFSLLMSSLDLSSLFCLPGPKSPPKLYLCCEGSPKLNTREGDLQTFWAQSMKVSFPILSADYLLLGVAQTPPFLINQLRLKKGAKSKAQTLLIVFATRSSDYPAQCKTDHKTGSEAISVHPGTQERFGMHLPPALKPSSVTSTGGQSHLCQVRAGRMAESPVS